MRKKRKGEGGEGRMCTRAASHLLSSCSANIVMAGKAESEGHHISFYDFMKASLPNSREHTRTARATRWC